jgi:hypothetical protein
VTQHLEPTAEHLAYWRRETQLVEPFVRIIGGPSEAPDVVPCHTVMSVQREEEGQGEIEFHVPMKLDDDELIALAHGGTLWLTTWTYLPIHRLEVQPAVHECTVECEHPFGQPCEGG